MIWPQPLALARVSCGWGSSSPSSSSSAAGCWKGHRLSPASVCPLCRSEIQRWASCSIFKNVLLKLWIVYVGTFSLQSLNTFGTVLLSGQSVSTCSTINNRTGINTVSFLLYMSQTPKLAALGEDFTRFTCVFKVQTWVKVNEVESSLRSETHCPEETGKFLESHEDFKSQVVFP